jgi:nitronate monooxygenase
MRGARRESIVLDTPSRVLYHGGQNSAENEDSRIPPRPVENETSSVTEMNLNIGAILEMKTANFQAACAAKYPLPELRIGRHTARLPIVQGGMGVGLSLSGLATAVAEEGGVGVIAATGIGMIEPDYYERPLEANLRALRSEIHAARRRTQGVLGVNIMVAADGFLQLVDAAVEEKIDLLFMGAGLPVKSMPMALIRKSGVGIVPIVSSGRAARLIFKLWEKHYQDIPDAVVVEGPRAGGHLGFKVEQLDDPAFQLEKIVPDVLEALSEFESRWGRTVPLIAGGGIYTGEDIWRILKLGARGVQMGTRFIATTECDADPRFKQAYVDCRKEDILIIHSPVGLPGRAIRSPFLVDVAQGVKKLFRCPSHCLESCGALEARYCIAEALDNARQGRLAEGFAFCGANTFRVTSVVPVGELMADLKQGFALAVVVGSIKTECAKAAEKMSALAGEYALTLARIREDFRDQLRRMNEDNRDKFRLEKARFKDHLSQIRRDYLKAKATRRELIAALNDLLKQPCLQGA